MDIEIINGPNLNLLGKREPSVYGKQDFESFFNTIKIEFPEHSLTYFQSNHEGDLIDRIQEIGFSHGGIVLNPGGLSHTSVALTDVVAAVSTPIIEVHISNIHDRERFRHHSYISRNALGTIVGLGLNGYRLAIRALIEK